VGSELLTEGGLVALEAGLVSLGGALDLLLGDQPRLGSHLGVEERRYRDPSPLRLLDEELLGDERLDLLALRWQICSWKFVSCAARALPTSSAVIICPSTSAGGSLFGAV
jgi:hypothetical protein